MLFGNKSSFAIETEVNNFFHDDYIGEGKFIVYIKNTPYGIDNEFFIAPRIDNLECAYTSLQALINNYQNKRRIKKLPICCKQRFSLDREIRLGERSILSYDFSEQMKRDGWKEVK